MNEGLRPVLNLGRTPLANALLTAEQLTEPEAVYPLELVFCPACTLVQITETMPPEQLFREYFYLSSFSDTLLRHAEEIAGQLSSSRRLDTHSLVIEIASNDGYLLQYYKRAGIPVLGIVFYASLCKAIERGRVIGIDIEIREHNRKASEAHQLFPFITLIKATQWMPMWCAKLRLRRKREIFAWYKEELAVWKR